jgi:8-oxo-dGTP pyrophosphatase MutT (NUDIX family)
VAAARRPREDGEDPRQAVLREAREELGIAAELADDRPFFLTVTPTNGPRSHLDVDLWFVLQVRRGAPLTPDPREFASVRWFGLDDQRDWPSNRYDPEMGRFAAKLRSVLGPLAPARSELSAG